MKRGAWLTLLLFACGAWAQDPNAAGGSSEAQRVLYSGSLTAGRLLPFGIYGVRDIYPYWGFTLGHQWGKQDVEWGGSFIHADSVRWNSGTVSLLFPNEIEGMKFVPSLGLDVIYYSGHTNLRLLPYKVTLGVHFGFAPIFEITHSVAIRADFRFGFSPGQTLYVGSGLQFSY